MTTATSTRTFTGERLAAMCLAACCAASIITAWNHPVRVTPGEATSLATDLPLPTHTVAINTAVAAEFRLLPGIGAVLAERIEQNRVTHGRFASVDDLTRVSGIGPKTIERIRPFVRCDQ